MENIDNLKFDENGLIPAIVQDYITKDVLMLAYMNKESFERTIETGQAYYFSRSRNSLWLKGETSGHYQNIKEIKYDCDCDTILLIVEQIGSACHTGNKTCFYRSFVGDIKNIKETEKENNGAETSNSYEGALIELYSKISDRKNNPIKGSYTNYLFDEGIDKILKKVGEEAAEIIIGAKNEGNDELIYETADLLYHLTVLLVDKDTKWEEIFYELMKRRK